MIEAILGVFAPIIHPMSVAAAALWPIYGVALAFAGLWLWSRARAVAIAAVLWIAYAVYESLMYLRVLCSGDCNIRIDLLLFYPVLLISAILAVLAALRSKRGIKPN